MAPGKPAFNLTHKVSSAVKSRFNTTALAMMAHRANRGALAGLGTVSGGGPLGALAMAHHAADAHGAEALEEIAYGVGVARSESELPVALIVLFSVVGLIGLCLIGVCCYYVRKSMRDVPLIIELDGDKHTLAVSPADVASQLETHPLPNALADALADSGVPELETLAGDFVRMVDTTRASIEIKGKDGQTRKYDSSSTEAAQIEGAKEFSVKVL